MNQSATTTVYVNNEPAKRALTEIQNKLVEVKQAQKEAFEKGDFNSLKSLDKEVKSLEASGEKLKKRFFDISLVLHDLSGASLTDLRKALAITNTEFNKMRQTDPGYKEKEVQVKKLTSAVENASKAQRKNTSETGFWGKSLGDIKGLLPTLGVTALITGLINLGKQVFKVRQEFQKYEAILKNTLGSDDAGRQALNMLTETAASLPISLKEAT